MMTNMRRISVPRTVAGILAVLALACAGGGPADPPGNGNGNGNGPPPPPPPPPPEATIVVDPSTTHQTILGWEGTMMIGEPVNEAQIETYADELIPRVVGELGLNRVRLEVRSGSQNTVDWFTRWKNGQISTSEWHAHWYEINPQRTYFFSEVDFWVEHGIDPIRSELAARGEDLYVNVTYVNFEDDVPNQLLHHWEHPEAYGAFMAALFRHMDSEYGWVPDAIEVVLEPDNIFGWTGTRIGQALAAAGDSLRAAGYNPDFIAPSTTSMAAAIDFFDDIVAVPGARQYLKEIAYHRYRNVAPSHLEAIAQRGRQFNLRTAMLEHIGSGYLDLHQDLKVGANSAWQQFTIAYPVEGGDNGGSYYRIANGNQVVLAERSRYLQLYFRYVRRGAVRIGATSRNGDLDPLAFRNANGSFVVVVKAADGATFTIGGLPAGTYGVRYTTDDVTDVNPGPLTVSQGGLLSTSIPGEGVLTVFRQ